MTSVVWTIPARDDLRAIDDWLTRETSPHYAIRTLAAIRTRSKFLQDFPKGGRPRRNQTRILRVLDTPYRLRYRIRSGVVEMLPVYHEREDWSVEP